MPKLDDRLKTVARFVRCRVHADIGSDHGHLLKALLKSGRIQHGIAIENKRQPFENSSKTLAGLEASVRFADGLEGLCEGEADSLSICGMGGQSIVRILEAFTTRVATTVVLQPNRRSELVRAWGLRSGFHLTDELTAMGHWPYCVLRFVKSDCDDPIYRGLDQDAAILLGPHNLVRWQPDFVDRIRSEVQYLRNLDRLGTIATARVQIIERLLSSKR